MRSSAPLANPSALPPHATKEREGSKSPPSEPSRKLRRDERTLVYFIKTLIGQRVAVELWSDAIIKGVLDDCDNSLNLQMSNTVTRTVAGRETRERLVNVPGRHVRHVMYSDKIQPSTHVEAYRQRQYDAIRTIQTTTANRLPKGEREALDELARERGEGMNDPEALELGGAAPEFFQRFQGDWGEEEDMGGGDDGRGSECEIDHA